MEENQAIDVQMLVEAVTSGNITVILLMVLPLFSTLLSAITTVLPTRYKSVTGDTISYLLGFVAFNFGRNANADDPEARQRFKTNKFPG